MPWEQTMCYFRAWTIHLLRRRCNLTKEANIATKEKEVDLSIGSRLLARRRVKVRVTTAT